MLDQSTLNELIAILEPLVQDIKERHALLNRAFFNHPLLSQIDYEGTSHVFVVNLIVRLDSFGEIERGKTALWVLLETVRDRVGVDKQSLIDQLHNVINKSTPSFAAAPSALAPPVSFSPHIENIGLKLATECVVPNNYNRGWFTVVKFTPDGKSLVGGMNQDWVSIWEVTTGKLKNLEIPKHSIQLASKGDWPVYNIAISPNGKLLATPTGGQIIQIWYVNGLRSHSPVATVNHRPISLAFSPDGNWLVAGLDTDGTIHLYAVYENFRRTDYENAHTARVEKIRFHPSKPNFVSCAGDGKIFYWTIIEEAIRKIRSFDGHDRTHILDVAISPDGQLLASGSDTGEIHLWELETGQSISRDWYHEKHVRTLAFTPDSKFLASGSNDETVKIWSVANGSKLLSKKFDKAIRAIDISSDGCFLVTHGDCDRTAQIWAIRA
jgi:WD40 repeat protein